MCAKCRSCPLGQQKSLTQYRGLLMISHVPGLTERRSLCGKPVVGMCAISCDLAPRGLQRSHLVRRVRVGEPYLAKDVEADPSKRMIRWLPSEYALVHACALFSLMSPTKRSFFPQQVACVPPTDDYFPFTYLGPFKRLHPMFTDTSFY